MLTMFEERLFGLVELSTTLPELFAAEDIPYELVCGMAVAVQIDRVDPDEVMLARDIDVMIRRSDLQRVQDVVGRHGFYFRHKAGQAPNPELAPERIIVYGQEVPVVPIDLVRMKRHCRRCYSPA